LRTLRRLLETPRFAAWIGARCSLFRERLLAACDALTLELLAETLSEPPIPPGGIRDKEMHGDATRLQKTILGELTKGPAELVAAIWKEDPADGVEEVLDVCAESSPVLESWPDPAKAREASLPGRLPGARASVPPGR